jgi:putative peptidoglycan lipid II flippase
VYFGNSLESVHMSSTESSDARGRIVRSASIITPLTLVSRATGYLRDKVIALLLGAGTRSDAFFVAFRIPNMLREIVGEGAMSSAFIPVYAEVSETRPETEARAFVGRALGTFSLLLASLTVLGIASAPLLVDLLARRFRANPGQFELTVLLNRWMWPYVFLVSLSAFCQAILNARHRFAIAAAAPIFLNVAMILGALVISPRLAEPTYGLVAGVLLGGVLQVAVQVPQLRRLGAVGRPALGWRDPAVRSVILLMTPRLFAYGVNTINTVISTRFASSLEGGVSHFYYANRLKELVLGGFAVSLATAILPLLSRQALAADRGPFKGNLAFALRLILFVTVPATVGLVLLRVPIVRILFEGGRFRPADTGPTADALGSLAAGLIFFAGVRVLVPAFYALKDTRLPVLAATADCATFVGLCALLTKPLGLAGIGFAASAAALVNVAILLVVLRRREGRLRGREIAASAVRIVLAAGAMGAAIVASRRFIDYDSWRGALGGAALAATIGFSAAIYWTVASGLRAPEPAELRGVARRRRGGKPFP